MCGRYTLTHGVDVLGDEFGVELPEALVGAPRYNIAPTQPVLIVLERKTRAARAVRWGLWPSWTKEPAKAPLLINARAESLAEKPAFRAALRTQRCLVLADGFYEWRKDPGAKQPFYLRLRTGRPFAFAGLWDLWRDADGRAVPSCTVVTVPPNEVAAAIHDRMPAILAPDAYDRWLSARLQEPDDVLPLLRPYPPEAMEAYAVSPYVNAVAHDDARCIAPQ